MTGKLTSFGIRHFTLMAAAAACFSFGSMVAAPVAEAGCKDSADAGVDWSGCRKRNVILSGTDFTGANFNKTDLFGSDLRETNFSGADLSRAVMTRVNISVSNLTKANFQGRRRSHGFSKCQSDRGIA